MRRSWALSLLTSILVAGIIAVLAVAAVRPDTGASVAPAAAAADDERDEPGKGEDMGGGPPPWAHANGQGKAHGADHAWKEAWTELTPAQKRERMAGLVRAHEQGMARWADCVAAAKNDPSERASCEKPLPPGLAKKNP
jgi:hypothetical protein